MSRNWHASQSQYESKKRWQKNNPEQWKEMIQFNSWKYAIIRYSIKDAIEPEHIKTRFLIKINNFKR